MVEPPIWKIWASNWSISPIFGMNIQTSVKTTIPPKMVYLPIFTKKTYSNVGLGYLREMHHSLRSVTTQGHVPPACHPPLPGGWYERKWSENSKKHTKTNEKRWIFNLIQFLLWFFHVLCALLSLISNGNKKISALYKKCPLKWVLDYIEQKKNRTLPKTNIAPSRRPFQKETHFPTPVFQVLC